MIENATTSVPNGSEGLCYVETRVLTRVGAAEIDGGTSLETVS